MFVNQLVLCFFVYLYYTFLEDTVQRKIIIYSQTSRNYSNMCVFFFNNCNKQLDY